jgi:hypothetical protein
VVPVKVWGCAQQRRARESRNRVGRSATSLAHRVLDGRAMTKSLSMFSLALLLSLAGCAGTLPDPIYANEVDTFFPEEEVEAPTTTEGSEMTADASADVATTQGTPPEPTAPPTTDAETRHRLHALAGHCAARLNGHRSTAETVSIIQGIIGGIGGVTGGVGSALAVVHFDSPDINTAMAVMGSVGAGITFVGNLILGFVANPLEEIRRQGLGLRSWEMAVELQLAHADTAVIESHLQHCVADEGPTPHLTGEGEPYAE